MRRLLTETRETAPSHGFPRRARRAPQAPCGLGLARAWTLEPTEAVIQAADEWDPEQGPFDGVAPRLTPLP